MKMNRHLKIFAIIYGIAWAIFAVVFWIFFGNQRILQSYILPFKAVCLPMIILILSVFIGREDLPKSYFYFAPLIFAATFLVLTLLTDSLWHQLFSKISNYPKVLDFLAIVLISAVGILIGRIRHEGHHS